MFKWFSLIAKLLKAKKKYYKLDIDFKPDLKLYAAKVKAMLKQKRIQLHKVYLITLPA